MVLEYRIVRTSRGVDLYRVSEDGRVITSEEIEPDASWKLRRHSPDGFEYGYSGSGPAQLALAILLDSGRDISPDADTLALEHYQDFKDAFLAARQEDAFSITLRQIVNWLAACCMQKQEAL